MERARGDRRRWCAGARRPARGDSDTEERARGGATAWGLILFTVNLFYMILTLDCVFKGEGDDGDIESVEFLKCIVASN